MCFWPFVSNMSNSSYRICVAVDLSFAYLFWKTGCVFMLRHLKNTRTLQQDFPINVLNDENLAHISQENVE